MDDYRLEPLKENCQDCKCFHKEGEDGWGKRIRYYCLKYGDEGEYKEISDCYIYFGHYPSWCPGFEEPPEEPSEELKQMFRENENEEES